MFSLNYRDTRPVWEQVKDGLRRLVASGAIYPGEVLPEAGTMAASLAINPTTIRRAYEDLAREGYLTVLPDGKSYTAASVENGGERRRQLLERFDRSAMELLFLGMTVEELTHRVSAVKGGKA